MYRVTLLPPQTCRKRTGEALLRAEEFGDLITADHKVLSENCESRNNHVCNRGTRFSHSIDSVVPVRHISQETANLVKTYPQSIVLEHSIELRRMVLMKERYTWSG